ncbi:Protein-tyrosine phosphatase family protein [Acanthocheilonema viteae]
MSRGRMKCSVLPDEGGSKIKDKRSLHSRLITQEQIVGRKFVRRPKAITTIKGKLSVQEEWMQTAAQLGIRGIRKEFVNEIKNYTPKNAAMEAWNLDQNFDKNRYEDIKLEDKTRVKLKKIPNNDDDYIHASYVIVSNDLTYICAQGPLLNTVQDFWIMAIQEQTNVILQLCQNKENDREQCSEYFPNESIGWKEYGAVRVRITEPTSGIVTLKKVTRTKIEASYSDKKQEVMHIAYAGWPDHSVPDSPATCREIYSLLRKYYGKKPIIVHCSAGVGRTGTFVAIEMAMEKLRKNETCIVVDITKKLREQRLHAVQNDLQYLFIYRMMIELLVEENLLSRDQQVINFLKEYDNLIARKRRERMLKDNLI